MNNNSLDDKLKQLDDHILSSTEKTRQRGLPSRYGLLAETVRGSLVSNHAGSFCQVVTRYPFGFRFGNSRLDRPEPGNEVAAAAFSADEVEGGFSLRDLLFFDLETTGLGGAGTVAFLVGCGLLTARGFEVRQYLLPDYSDEAALLEHFLAELSEKKAIVSYNGAAFDLNVIRDRMIINRVAREVPFGGHIDLLHATRRLYRRRLGDCSLVNIEREIFGFARCEDIPGYLVPSAYFDWLSSQEPRAIPDVLEHNRQDILTLYFLLLKIAGIFESEGSTLKYADDIYSLSRVYGRRRRNDKVVDLHRRMSEESNSEINEEVLLYHSFAFKRTGDWSGAVRLWHRLTESQSKEGFLANIELAKYFEHQAGDPRRAYEFASRAQRVCPPATRWRADLRKRLSRLQVKIKS